MGENGVAVGKSGQQLKAFFNDFVEVMMTLLQTRIPLTLRKASSFSSLSAKIDSMIIPLQKFESELIECLDRQRNKMLLRREM
jgi:hypothetical protein